MLYHINLSNPKSFCIQRVMSDPNKRKIHPQNHLKRLFTFKVLILTFNTREKFRLEHTTYPCETLAVRAIKGKSASMLS